jgi:ATP-binding cassette subfamily B protein
MLRIMKRENDAEAQHVNLSVKEFTSHLKSRLSGILEPDEEILNEVMSDMTLDGLFEEAGLVLTNKRLISFDPKHHGSVYKVNLNEIRNATIEKMYGNSIFQVVLDNDETIDVNRFTNAREDFFYDFIKLIYEQQGRLEELASFETDNEIEKKYRCPKCGRILESKNAICTKCIDKRKVVRRLLQYVKPYRKLTFVVLFLSIIVTALPLIPPMLTKTLIDDVIATRSLDDLWKIVMALVLIYLFDGIFSGFRGYYLSKLSNSIIFNLRTKAFESVQKLTLKYYDKRSTGSIMSRVSNDTQRLQSFMITLTQSVIIQLLTLIGIMVFMFYMDWQLALLSIIPVPIVIFGSQIYAEHMRPRYRRIWRRMSRMNAILGDSIPGIRVIKAFNGEDRVIEKYTKQGEDLLNEHLTAAVKSSIYSPLITFLVVLGSILIWGLGGYWVITRPDRLSVGSLIAFINYAGRFYGPVQFFANFNDQLQQASTSAERVFEILDADPEPNLGKGNYIENLQGKIEFENVNFSYEKGKNILKNISLTVQPGETIGIVGSTGSGKSTLVNLILRFYEPTEGRIKIDGHDIADIDIDFLRKNIGYVLQEPLLFRDTIANNIIYSKPDATIEEVIDAAKVANAHKFIIKFPDAYDTVLGERGTGLSGGEKQRVSIARAVIKNPRILILDEATSAVDTETEKLIQEAIDRLIKNRTTLIIAHRLSTLRKAHKILVLENGEIVEFGTQEELMSKKGRYYDLVQMQTDLGSDIIRYK